MSKHNATGFTLIELVMVIVLVGIISIYAAPRFGALSTYNLTDATGELVEAIRFAQENSMIRVDDTFQITLGGADGYRVRQNGANINSPLTGAASFTADGWDNITVTSDEAVLSFDTRGYPCNNATCNEGNQLAAALTITLTASDGENRTITVEPITGYAYAN